MSDSDLEFKFGATAGDLTDEIGKVREQLAALKESTQTIGEGFSKLGEIVGIAFSIEGLKNFIESMAELGEKTERTMAILGASADQVATLGLAARMTGTDADTLTMQMSRFQLSLAKAATGTGPAAAGLKALGLTAKDFIGVPIPQQFEKLSEAVSKFADGVNKTAALTAIQRGFAQLIPLLDQGKEGYQRLDAQMQELLPDQESFTAGAAETQRQIVTLQTAVLGFGEKLFNVLKPAIDGAIVWVTNFVKSFDEGTLRRALAAMMDVVIDIVRRLEAAVGDALYLIGKLVDGMKTVGSAIDWLNTHDITLHLFDKEGLGFTAPLKEGLDTAAASSDSLAQKLGKVKDQIVGITAQTANQRFWGLPNVDMSAEGPHAVGGAKADKPQAGALDLSKPAKAGTDKLAKSKPSSKRSLQKARFGRKRSSNTL